MRLNEKLGWAFCGIGLLIVALLAAHAHADYPIGGSAFRASTGRAVTPLGSGPTTLDVATISAGGCVDTQVTLTGAAAGAPCIVGFAGRTTGVTATCRVSATNTIQLQSCSPVAADPASQSYNFVVFNN